MELEEAIQHCIEVAEEKDDFMTATAECKWWHRGWEDGWVDTCRHPDNIPEGCSWGECDINACPIFGECLECASEHRQLAEWLRELIKLRKFTHFVATHVMADDFEDNGSFYAEAFCRRLNKLGVIRHEGNNWIYDGEVKADDT